MSGTERLQGAGIHCFASGEMGRVDGAENADNINCMNAALCSGLKALDTILVITQSSS